MDETGALLQGGERGGVGSGFTAYRGPVLRGGGEGMLPDISSANNPSVYMCQIYHTLCSMAV